MKWVIVSLSLLVAPAAWANNTFGILEAATEGQSFYDVRLVRATAPGTVEIRNSKGTLLGRTSVRAGVNTGVRVRFTSRYMPPNDVFAVLIVGGKVVDRDRIRVF